MGIKKTAAFIAVCACVFGVFAVEVSDAFLEDSSSYTLKPLQGDEIYYNKLPIIFPYDPKLFREELPKLSKRQNAIDNSYRSLIDSNNSAETRIAKKYIPDYVSADSAFITELKDMMRTLSVKIGTSSYKICDIYSGYAPFAYMTDAVLRNCDSLADISRWQKYGINELSSTAVNAWVQSVSGEFQKVLSAFSKTIDSHLQNKQDLFQKSVSVVVSDEDFVAVQKYLQDNAVALGNVTSAISDYFSNITYCQAYISSFFAAYFSYRDRTPVEAKTPNSFYVPSKSK